MKLNPMNWSRYFLVACILLGMIPFSLAGGTQAVPTKIMAFWSSAGMNQELKTWNQSDLERFKWTTSREVDPLSGQMTTWHGVVISQLVEAALGKLPPESRASVDLIVLKNREGKVAYISRASISKYPFLLALRWNPKGSPETESQRGWVYSIAPWSSNPRLRNEGLPLEKFFVPAVSEIEFTNYRERFGAFFLRRRTDPLAVRGEKLFVQNCISCHQPGPKTLKLGFGAGHSEFIDQAASFTSHVRHAKVESLRNLSERNRKSILRYLEARRMEALSTNVVGASGLKSGPETQ